MRYCMNNDLENIKSRFDNYLPEFILKAPYLKEIFNSEIFESYYLNKYAKELLKRTFYINSNRKEY